MAIKAFEIDDGANCPKAVAKIVDHADLLLEFYRCRALDPAAHHEPDRMHFRDAAFAHQDHQRSGSHAAGLAMACSRCWRLSSLKDQWYEPGLRASSARSLTRPL